MLVIPAGTVNVLLVVNVWVVVAADAGAASATVSASEPAIPAAHTAARTVRDRTATTPSPVCTLCPSLMHSPCIVRRVRATEGHSLTALTDAEADAEAEEQAEEQAEAEEQGPAVALQSYRG
ncbi:hypothetical protein [Streptomyces sp. NPDC051567]|uniref:hypothetical protein n=1 Tax=Streptomyces sp. NPDC051567 TaxID=3365660 RepID=UPI00378F8150